MKSRLLVVLATIAVMVGSAASPTLAKSVSYRHIPAHYYGWICIHNGEGSWHDWDSGHNGHYGGLQMHPGWGYGTSYYAAKDSPLVQVWAAERGYRASGYSHSWLYGQWGADFPRCTRYF